MPSESALCKQFNVSPTTVRRCIQALLEQQLVSTIKGSGTYVKTPTLRGGIFSMEEFYRIFEDRVRTKVRMLEVNIVKADAAAAERLQIKRGARTILIRRLFIRDGDPIIYLEGQLIYDPVLRIVEAELEEEETIATVGQAVSEGAKPLDIIRWCHKGMVQVGERYEKGEYAIAGLIMAGEIMRQVGELIFPHIESSVHSGDSGRIVLGTIEGDIHYIGKDIFKMLVRGYGFTVHDLGVDVPQAKFLSAILETKPDIVGFSCLLTHTFNTVRETVSFLKENVPEQLAPRAYIVGGRIDRHIARDIGTANWADDAMKGVQLCRSIMAAG